jgi:hypothetical protein
MKLRLDKYSVRLRLSKEEILNLQNDGYLEEKVSFSENNYFQYVIEIVEDIDTCEVYFGEEGLEVDIPFEISEKWINSNQVGIKESIETDEGDSITLLIEEELPPRKKG